MPRPPLPARRRCRPPRDRMRGWSLLAALLASLTWLVASAPAIATTGTATAPSSANRWTTARRHQARALLDALGLSFGTSVDDGDLRRAADRLDVAVGAHVSPADLARMLAAQRARAAGVLTRLGIDYGTRVDAADVRRGATRVGLDVGTRVDPADVSRLIAVGSSPGVVARYTTSRRARSAALAQLPFATLGAVALLPPSHHVRLIGFHQAASHTADELTPTDRAGLTTLPSRGRGTSRHSAADVAVVANTTVVAPVTGTVLAVEHYALYGRYDDLRLRFAPAADPTRIVTVLHVVGARVGVGDTVEAGVTPIADHAHQLPFTSQIDEVAGRGPHVHVEVHPR